MSRLAFTLTVTMELDWHIGSGQGRHRSIDRLIDRDHEDLPFLPAPTLRGIWRDAAQTLACGLDGPDNVSWARLVDEIFGSEPVLNEKCETAPVSSRIDSDRRTFPRELAQPSERAGARTAGAAAGSDLREAGGVHQPAFGPGADEVPALRRSGTRWRVAGGCGPDRVSRDMWRQGAEDGGRLLVGAAALIERLGGKRRRGMGKCKVEVHFGDGFAENGSNAADVLRDETKAPVLSAPAPDTDRPHGFSAASSGVQWTKFPLRLTLLSPIVAADEVQGNVITCQNHIPGSLLLPHVARCLDGQFAGVWQRIASGDIRVLPGTPEIDGDRSLPIPMCWEEPKARGSGKPWRQIREADESDKTQYKPVRAGFIQAREHVLQRSVEKVLRTHNTVEDEYQRPGEAVGGVYTYEALATDQIFRSEVWIRGVFADDQKAKMEAALYGNEACIGRARHAGYGRVLITKPDKDEQPPTAAARMEMLTVWLTTDAILPAGTGGGGLEALAEGVAAATGCAMDAFDISASWGSLRWRRIEGWQSRWGLPRPTLTALQAGSVAIFKLRGDVMPDVTSLERNGIGERRGEGFGCVLVNHDYLEGPPPDVRFHSFKPQSEQPNGEAAAVQSSFLETISRRAWERCIALRTEMAAATARQPGTSAWLAALERQNETEYEPAWGVAHGDG